MVHREGNIGAEMHDAWADVYVISSGGGTIQGGMRQRVAPGDFVHIPAKTPHAMLIEPGKQITYFIFKVKPA